MAANIRSMRHVPSPNHIRTSHQKESNQVLKCMQYPQESSIFYSTEYDGERKNISRASNTPNRVVNDTLLSTNSYRLPVAHPTDDC
jgi:hypothetical protein